ncbi:uncharacterized protein LOC126976423 [Leptidea sinapis]|uniref:uncharacterized protein LOC126976423 n=1 Tax=Leptidea sinapis TaxID=189913 RepID=UPI002139FC14|nr:uncharacterized protein LOC126976423 [Leptidea sinapis]
MIAKIVFVLAVLELGFGDAVPYWQGNPYNSGMYLRNPGLPNIAIGFGSGFSSNINGVSHSSGFGSSFRSGDAEAYGSGIGSSNGYAQGVGYANAAPNYAVNYNIPSYQHVAPNQYISSIPKYQYGAQNHQVNAVPHYQQAPVINSGHRLSPVRALSQDHGTVGNSLSSVQSHNAGSIIGAANSNLGHQSAVSSIQDPKGHGSSYAATNSYQPSPRNGQHLEKAITSTQDIDGYKIHTAESVQQHGNLLQNSGATNIQGPGIQVAQAHAISTGYY